MRDPTMLEKAIVAVQTWVPGVSNDVVFTTVVSISIFVLGYFFNRFYDNWKERARNRDIREFVFTSLDAMVPAIDKQIAGFNDLKDQLASKRHQDYIFVESTSLNFENLDSVPRDQIFRAFARGRRKKRGERIKHLNSLWRDLDFIRHQREPARQAFVQFRESYRRYLLSWNENVDAIARLHDEYHMMSARSSVRPSEDPFFREFNLIVHRLDQAGGPKSWESEKARLLDPLREVCKVHHLDSRANAVMKKIIQADFAFDNRKHLLESYGNYFSQQSAALMEKKASIMDVIQVLPE